MNLPIVSRPSLSLAPQLSLWRMLLSGNRERIAKAVEQINDMGQNDDYAGRLLAARRRNARRVRRWFGVFTFTTAYTERERRSALTALSLLWGSLGRELAFALDPKATHFEREHAHKALIRRRDQRAVQPLIDALIDGHAVEDWQCIPTLGALGDLRAADGLLRYIGLNQESPCIDIEALLDIGIDVGKALRNLNAHTALAAAQGALNSPLAHQRVGGALILAGWGDEALAHLVVPLVEDHSDFVRIAAITALGELKVIASMLPLRDSLADPNPKVRLAAERALQQVAVAEAQQASKLPKYRRKNPARR